MGGTKQAAGARPTPAFRRPSLSALTTAALALPGIGLSPAAAQQSAGSGLQTDYLFSYYRESDIPGSRTINGQASERYQIRSHSLRAAQAFDERSLALDIMFETLSGASPWYVQPDADGRPVQVMSGPTIHEERLDVAISGDTPISRELSMEMSAGISDEDDYRAHYGTLELRYEPGGLPAALSASLSYSDDRIEPVEGTTPVSVTREDKSSLRGTVSASYALNQETLVQAAVGYQRHSGFLSDPYKAVWLEQSSGIVPDARPGGRRGAHVLARIRHFVRRLGGALHADYRYYGDNWEIRSHTAELSWQQTLAQSWRISPGVRWYSQSQAFFYAPFFESAPDHGFVSSDYRLAPFGALSYRLDVTHAWNNLVTGAGIEHYRASGSYATGSVDIEAPGLVRYTAFTARLAYSF